MMSLKRAVLGLADGLCLFGYSYGKEKQAVGELVFNTSMTGYQEIITDPSYMGQIILFTCPHIGNTGINDEDNESLQIHAAGVVLRDVSPIRSSWRAKDSLNRFLKRGNCPAIYGLDTRMLTRHLRDSGCQNASIVSFNQQADPQEAAQMAIAKARKHPPMQSTNLANLASGGGKELLRKGLPGKDSKRAAKVLVYDCGIKQNIIRHLEERNCRVVVVDPQTTAASMLDTHKPNGVLISNGPGDPAACDKIIEDIRLFLKHRIPLFGICLGHQLLGLACGMRSIKLKFGHHGANHPVQDIGSGLILISSQNHNFALSDEELPDGVHVSHRSLFDNTVQGIELTDRPAFAFQGHPEASPGPREGEYLFGKFINIIQKHAGT